MPNLTVRRKSLYRLAKSTGRIFTVVFRKKDGTMRTMNCRTGVTSHLRGGECCIPAHMLKGEPYVTVFDVQKGDYRVFNAETATVIRMNGKEYTVID